MKKIITIFLFLFSTILYGEEFLPKITTVNDILKNVIEKYNKIRTYRARFYIKTVVGDTEKKASGVIKYKMPDKFIMKFRYPREQLIYSDGETLKIYVPKLKVVGEQRLGKYRSSLFVSGKTSLYYLRNKYNFSFAESNKPVMLGETPVYILKLTQKETRAGFKEIKLYISQNYWMILKAEATTLSGNYIRISFSNIAINIRITKHEFEFNLPVDTQTVIDPLIFKIK